MDGDERTAEPGWRLPPVGLKCLSRCTLKNQRPRQSCSDSGRYEDMHETPIFISSLLEKMWQMVGHSFALKKIQGICQSLC